VNQATDAHAEDSEQQTLQVDPTGPNIFKTPDKNTGENIASLASFTYLSQNRKDLKKYFERF
jgi:UDP-galactopyranose mutase